MTTPLRTARPKADRRARIARARALWRALGMTHAEIAAAYVEALTQGREPVTPGAESKVRAWLADGGAGPSDAGLVFLEMLARERGVTVEEG